MFSKYVIYFESLRVREQSSQITFGFVMESDRVSRREGKFPARFKVIGFVVYHAHVGKRHARRACAARTLRARFSPKIFRCPNEINLQRVKDCFLYLVYLTAKMPTT